MATFYYYLIPVGTSVDTFSGGNVGGASRQAVTADPWASPDDIVSYCQHDANGADGTIRFDMSDLPPEIQNIVSVRAKARTLDVDGNSTTVTLLQRLGGSTQGAVAATGAWADLLTAAFAAAPGGALWTPTLVNNLQLDVTFSAAVGLSRQDLTQVGLEVGWIPSSSSGIESFREAISRRLRMRYLAPRRIELVWPGLEWIDVEPGQLFFLSHPDLPGPDARGAGVKAGEPWPVRKISSQVDERTMTETMVLEDWREVLCTFLDVGKSRKGPAVYADGVARLDAGNSRSWLRSTVAYVRTPNNTVVQVAADTDKLDKDGLLYETASTNELLHSAFKDGAANVYTSWTQSGTGSNGSSILDDPTELLFDPITTGVARSVKLTAGSPIHAADMYLQSTSTATILANTICRFSIWHKDDSGAALAWALQRSSDSKWFRNGDQTWQVALTWNTGITVSASRARGSSRLIDVGTSDTTLTLRVGIPNASGVAGQVNHLYHVQLERRKFVTSTIVTEAAAVTTVGDKVTIGNPSNAPALPPVRSTTQWRVIPEWNASEVTTENKTVFYVEHDVNNYEWLYYDGANARWVYEVKAAGSTYRSVMSHSPVAGTQYLIVTRKVSAAGELAITPQTLSLFVDKVKGTDVVAAPIVVATNAFKNPGSRNGADCFDGNIWQQEITQQVRSDAQIGRY